ncbi:IS110 family transposase [Chloroflexi bacterium TSY]|nr:IS110 family transposase [Chloroflexi bacterium TSY]
MSFKPSNLPDSCSIPSTQATLQQLNSLFLQHEDHPIFASLPGAGELLAPSLLVKFGEDRRRFPHSSMVQTLAGTAPVTNQSGKVRGPLSPLL